MTRSRSLPPPLQPSPFTITGDNHHTRRCHLRSRTKFWLVGLIVVTLIAQKFVLVVIPQQHHQHQQNGVVTQTKAVGAPERAGKFSRLRLRNLHNRVMSKKSDEDGSSSSSSVDTIFCSRFPRGATASSIWRRHVSDILNASVHPADLTHRVHLAWTEPLLKQLFPHVLQQGIRSNPHRAAWYNLLHRVSENILQQQQQTNVNNSTTKTSPVHVVVFGGSVAYGRDCHKLPQQVLPFITQADGWKIVPKTGKNQDCAWPLRLQRFLDYILGENVVVVHNYAAGGTDTECALPKLQYNLYPDVMERGGPDVIINAYASNDNYQELCDPLHTKCLWNRTLSMAQQFLHASLGARPCLPFHQQPVVLYLDDYIGPAWNTILAEFQRQEALQDEFHHQYHGDTDTTSTTNSMVGLVSSMSVLYRWVWTMTQPQQQQLKLPSDVLSTPLSSAPHFFMPGHVARTWMLAYAMLQWTVDLCQDGGDNGGSDDDDHARRPAFLRHHHHHQQQQQQRHNQQRHSTTTTTASNDVVPATTAETTPFLSLTSSNDVLMAPPLQSHWRLEHITLEWQRYTHQYQVHHDMVCANHNNNDNFTTSTSWQEQQLVASSPPPPPPCSFSFVAGPAGTHTEPRQFRNYLRAFLTRNDDWSVTRNYENGFSNSLGFSATALNGSAVIRVSTLNGPVQVITTHYLKSYGEKWKNSLALFQLYFLRKEKTTPHNNYNNGTTQQEQQQYRPAELITSWQLSGYHDYNTSVSHVHRIDIGAPKAAQVGDVVELSMRLIGGNNFKLRSLLMCRH